VRCSIPPAAFRLKCVENTHWGEKRYRFQQLQKGSHFTLVYFHTWNKQKQNTFCKIGYALLIRHGQHNTTENNEIFNVRRKNIMWRLNTAVACVAERYTNLTVQKIPPYRTP